MTRTQLLAHIEQHRVFQDLPSAAQRHRDSSQVLDLLLDAIKEALIAGDSVTLRDFGTFLPRDKAARTGRNPHTGDPVAIPARTVAAFRSSLALRDLLNS